MSILDIHDVSVWYERDNVILEHVDLHLEKGAVYGLLGVNGARQNNTDQYADRSEPQLQRGLYAVRH